MRQEMTAKKRTVALHNYYNLTETETETETVCTRRETVASQQGPNNHNKKVVSE